MCPKWSSGLVAKLLYTEADVRGAMHSLTLTAGIPLYMHGI
jgi:hypothetical protein